MLRSLVQQWMDSPGHRENILRPDFSGSAIGAFKGSDGAIAAVQIFLGQTG
ncbi:CAP domain-containing protein [Desulfonatronovibrio hydrogenovorans]|uniref:CAP domain-containing protein n=1 Tax=Desulfonatronovibrio hydrogenovorans TaxID=53245 RepID=UPI00338DC058